VVNVGHCYSWFYIYEFYYLHQIGVCYYLNLFLLLTISKRTHNIYCFIIYLFIYLLVYIVMEEAEVLNFKVNLYISLYFCIVLYF